MRIATFFVCLLLTSCSGARGVVFRDGQMMMNTPELARGDACAALTKQIDQDIGEHWRSEVAIAELPFYEPDDRYMDEGWYWDKATVAVTLIGDGQAELAKTEADITAIVARRMTRLIQGGKKDLAVTIAAAKDPVKFAALAQPAPAAPVVRAATGPTTYTLQSGDTLAAISAAFYGTAQHWKTIADANPGLDPAILKPGESIVIPAKPTP
jgi:LysM repeat protein